MGRLPGRRRSGLTVVEVAIIASITLSLGIILMLFAAGWAQGSLLDLTRETDVNVEALRSALVIESMSYDSEAGEVNLTVRNVSKHDISLTAYRLELRSLENDTVYASMSLGLNLSQGEVAEIDDAPTCWDAMSPQLADDCLQTKQLVYRVYYIPTHLLDEGRLTSRTILYVDLSFVNPFLVSPPPVCPLPENWVIVDILDPVTNIESGKIHPFSGKGKIWVRLPLASESATIDLDIYVEEVRESGHPKSGSGSETVDIPSQDEYEVYGDYDSLGAPFRIRLSSDSYQVIPEEWVFAGRLTNPNNAKVHVSGIVLFWETEDRTINNVMLEMGADSQGDYRVIVRFKDCTGAVVATASREVHFLPGTSTANIFLEIEEKVRFDQVYVVETEVEEL